MCVRQTFAVNQMFHDSRLLGLFIKADVIYLLFSQTINIFQNFRKMSTSTENSSLLFRLNFFILNSLAPLSRSYLDYWNKKTQLV